MDNSKLSVLKVGFCYDVREDYIDQSSNLDYMDFVTLETVSEIKKSLERNGFEVVLIGNFHNLINHLINRTLDVDIVFNIAEGFSSRNREALIPCILEAHNIPYTGSDGYGMCINLNKYHTNVLAMNLGINVPKSVCYKAVNDDVVTSIESIGYPIILKPNYEGGSSGICIVNNTSELIQCSQRLLETYSHEVIAEEYISGDEISVPILGNDENAQAIGVVMARCLDGNSIRLYDSSMKYYNNIVREVQDASVGTIFHDICEIALKIHKELGLNDYSRMDFRLSDEGVAYFLEVNTLPSLGRNGTFEICAKSIGLDYDDIINSIVMNALSRNGIRYG